jgi:hypothetical protein
MGRHGDGALTVPNPAMHVAKLAHRPAQSRPEDETLRVEIVEVRADHAEQLPEVPITRTYRTSLPKPVILDIFVKSAYP